MPKARIKTTISEGHGASESDSPSTPSKPTRIHRSGSNEESKPNKRASTITPPTSKTQSASVPLVLFPDIPSEFELSDIITKPSEINNPRGSSKTINPQLSIPPYKNKDSKPGKPAKRGHTSPSTEEKDPRHPPHKKRSELEPLLEKYHAKEAKTDRINRQSTAEKKILMDGWEYAKLHPIAVLVAIVTAGPAAINSAMNIFGVSAKDFTQATWDDSSGLTRFMAILSGLSSLTVNGIMNASFNAEALKNLTANFKACCQSPSSFITSMVALLGGIAGALPPAFIALETLLPVGKITASSFALISLLNTFVTRFIGLARLFKYVSNHFNEDVKIQNQCVELLKHLNTAREEVEDNVNKFLKGKELTEETFMGLMELLNELVMKDQYKIFNERTSKEKSMHYAAMFVDVILATTLSFYSLMLGTEKGFTGLSEGEKLLGGTANLDNQTLGSKIGIGIIPGIVTSIFYYLSINALRETVLTAATEVISDDLLLRVPGALLLLGAVGLSAGGLKSVFEGMVKNPHSMWSSLLNAIMPKEPTLQKAADKLAPWMMGLAAGFVNLKATMGTVFSPSTTLSRNEAKVDATVAGFATALGNGRNPISKKSAGQLHKLGMFKSSSEGGETPLEKNYSNANRSSGII